MRTCRRMGPKDELGVVLSCSEPYFLRQDLLLSMVFLESAQLAGQQASGICLHSTPQQLGFRLHTYALAFNCEPSFNGAPVFPCLSTLVDEPSLQFLFLLSMTTWVFIGYVLKKKIKYKVYELKI